MWTINDHLDKEIEEHWPGQPWNLRIKGNYTKTVKDFFKEPIPQDPFYIPRFTLTTYQPTWVLSHYAFCLNDDSLWKPFYFELYKDRWEAHYIRESLEDEELNCEMQNLQESLINRQPSPPIIYSFDDDDVLFSDSSSKTEMTP